MEARSQSSANQILEDDDEWMDWETRNESIPIFKHIIAGMLMPLSHQFNPKHEEVSAQSTDIPSLITINKFVELICAKLFRV